MMSGVEVRRTKERPVRAGLAWLLIAAVLLTVWLSQGYGYVPGVYELPLGPCAVNAFINENTPVIACPGRDMLRCGPFR